MLGQETLQDQNWTVREPEPGNEARYDFTVLLCFVSVTSNLVK